MKVTTKTIKAAALAASDVLAAANAEPQSVLSTAALMVYAYSVLRHEPIDTSIERMARIAKKMTTLRVVR